MVAFKGGLFLVQNKKDLESAISNTVKVSVLKLRITHK